jgi:hypothetical protein
MKTSRIQIFSQGFSIMMRSGPMWLVALAVAVANLVIGLVLPVDSVLWTIINGVKGALTGAFLTGALITIANAAAEGQSFSFGEGFRAGARPFLPLVALDLILAVPIVLGTLILTSISDQVTANLSSSNAITSLAPGLVVMLCCLIPLLLVGALVFAGLGIGAERAVALEAAGVGHAFARGWNLLKAKFRDFVVIGLVMLAIGVAVGILFGCASVVVALASGVSAGNVTTSVANLSSSLIYTIIMSLVIVPVEIYFSAVWTLAFRRWQGKDLPQVEPAVVPPANFPPGV